MPEMYTQFDLSNNNLNQLLTFCKNAKNYMFLGENNLQKKEMFVHLVYAS